MKNLITIIMGEPESINTEIIAKSYKKLNSSLQKKILIVGSLKLFQKQLNVLKIKLAVKTDCIEKPDTKANDKNINPIPNSLKTIL